jgi:hypothetical protein
MKKRLFTLMAMPVFTGLLVFAACGGGHQDEAGAPAGGAAPDASLTEAQAPPSETSLADLSGGGLEWDDLPLYPGAEALKRDTSFFKKMVKQSHTEKGDMQFFSTEDDAKAVLAFYEAEMPKKGWMKIMTMPMGEKSTLSTWAKAGKDRGVSISIVESDEDSRTGITYIMGEGNK